MKNNNTLVYFSPDAPRAKEKTIEMTIKLDSWSPIYKDINGLKYREKLDPECFDHILKENKKINSYLDHKVSIEYLLASTKNNSLEVHKEGDTIYARILDNPKNKLLTKVVDWIEAGVIESNSFIFKNALAEVIEKNTEELDYEVIYKKADLISIDPVYEGFFPQDRCRVYDKENNNPVAYSIERSKNMQEQVQEQKQNVEENQTQQKEQNMQEINEAKAYDLSQLENKIDIVISEQSKRNQILKDFVAKSANAAPQNTELSEAEFKELRHKASVGAKLTSEEKLKLFNKSIDYLTEAQKQEIKLLDGNIYNNLYKRALDGTTDLKGLALIENISIPGILTEINAIFPEFTEYTQTLPLTNLDEITKAVYVPDNSPITAVQEGADLPAFGGSTFKVRLRPHRYGVKLTQVNALSNGDEAWAAQIANAKNAIYRGLRKALYTDLFKHAASTFSASTYTGGFTSEAKRLTQGSEKFTFDDLEVVFKELIAKYGDGIINKYVITMHPSTLQLLELEWVKQRDDKRKGLYDPVARTYRGVPIIIAEDYPEDKVAKGKKVAAIFPKDALLAYGLTITVNENIYSDMSKDQSHKYVQTRGEIKLIDPHINSRFIEVK